ncbi:NF038129 family PEP-CTERM protein [Pseudoduganella sp. LjRoot289]|uniref:NF038129 family PEP-CTERM protein n=1 Tax=Pseudoduganella sp. LjRoot289 TaxID=3342314 RepID=UPI003ED0248B
MNNLKDILARLMLAVFLSCGAGAALAGPIYSVSIDTATLGSGPAYLGLHFNGLGNAAEASATVSNLTGALAGAAEVTGTVAGLLPGPLVFSNANGGSELVQGITLGGVFSFDLSFLLGAGDAGTTFGWALFSDTGYLGADGDLGTVSLQPGTPQGDVYLLDNTSALSSVQAVPEPATLWLMLLAALPLLLVARRRAE